MNSAWASIFQGLLVALGGWLGYRWCWSALDVEEESGDEDASSKA